jgi:DNA-directed RNA polymerase subunit RPC12/RpoP
MVKEKGYGNIKCPQCGKFIKKLASLCPYCGARTATPPDKGGFFCKNCGKRIPIKNIGPNKKNYIGTTSHCPYCGVKI